VAIVVNRTSYIVDVGPGVVRRASAAHKAGIQALEPSKLTRLFVTHLHSDHTAGFPDLILTPWVLGRRRPLEVLGPPGIRAMTDHIMAAYEEDIRERLEGLEPANSTGNRVHTREIAPGPIFQDSNVAVEAFPAQHGSLPAFGYKFHAPDRTIAISGDTAPAETCVEAYCGCDILIHELYSTAGLEGHSQAWRDYHSAVHTSSHELAEVASRARPGLLILYHQLFHGASEQHLLMEVQGRYDGDVVSGQDLDVY
jgi:ribonuclease BN (tRNA processing enzyme)